MVFGDGLAEGAPNRDGFVGIGEEVAFTGQVEHGGHEEATAPAAAAGGFVLGGRKLGADDGAAPGDAADGDLVGLGLGPVYVAIPAAIAAAAAAPGGGAESELQVVALSRGEVGPVEGEPLAVEEGIAVVGLEAREEPGGGAAGRVEEGGEEVVVNAVVGGDEFVLGEGEGAAVLVELGDDLVAGGGAGLPFGAEAVHRGLPVLGEARFGGGGDGGAEQVVAIGGGGVAHFLGGEGAVAGPHELREEVAEGGRLVRIEVEVDAEALVVVAGRIEGEGDAGLLGEAGEDLVKREAGAPEADGPVEAGVGTRSVGIGVAGEPGDEGGRGSAFGGGGRGRRGKRESGAGADECQGEGETLHGAAPRAYVEASWYRGKSGFSRGEMTSFQPQAASP